MNFQESNAGIVDPMFGEGKHKIFSTTFLILKEVQSKQADAALDKETEETNWLLQSCPQAPRLSDLRRATQGVFRWMRESTQKQRSGMDVDSMEPQWGQIHKGCGNNFDLAQQAVSKVAVEVAKPRLYWWPPHSTPQGKLLTPGKYLRAAGQIWVNPESCNCTTHSFPCTKGTSFIQNSLQWQLLKLWSLDLCDPSWIIIFLLNWVEFWFEIDVSVGTTLRTHPGVPLAFLFFLLIIRNMCMRVQKKNEERNQRSIDKTPS